MATDRRAFLLGRMAGIGGSDVGALIGVDENKTIWEVWRSKVLEPTDADVESESGDTWRGRYGEGVCAQEYERKYEVALLPPPEGGVVHPTEPWMRCNPDRLLLVEGKEVPVEIKCPRIPKFYEMKEKGLDKTYIAQLQHTMAVGEHRGWDEALFLIYCGEYNDLYAFRMVRNQDLVAHLHVAEARFWHEYVLPRVQPPAPLPEPALWPTAPGEATLRDDAAWRLAAEAYVHFYYEAKEAQRFLAEAEAPLLALLGKEERHVTGGGLSVKRFSTPSQRRFDTKRFLADYRLHRAGSRAAPDPDDTAYYYQTQPNDKVEITVRVPEPEALSHA